MDKAQLLQALQALYRSEDPKLKEQANTWLEQWQQSTEAWSVSDAVLHDPASTMEAQFFCAQTLRAKVRRSPAQDHDPCGWLLHLAHSP